LRKYHQEVDELRKTGALKEALDLARYAHSQLPEHRLLQRSYGWAIYSYLKQKCRGLEAELKKGDLHHRQLVEATSTRVVEVNQLCREYRLRKLMTNDLCFSLILRRLCHFDPPPLGLYGLLKWARSTGLRAEDYKEEPVNNTAEKRPILLYLLASRLSSLVSVLDEELAPSMALQSLDVREVASFAAKVHIHAHKECVSPPYELAWGACWLSRRGGEYSEGVKWGLVLLSNSEYPPSVWWEVALCLAEESQSYKTLKKVSLGQNVLNLNYAFPCALAATHEARTQGVDEGLLANVYARAGFWAYYLGHLQSARALLTWAIKIRTQRKQKIPFDWVSFLNDLGGELIDISSLLSELDQRTYQQAQSWLKAQIIEDVSSTKQ
jgi:hypothetical protein